MPDGPRFVGLRAFSSLGATPRRESPHPGGSPGRQRGLPRMYDWIRAERVACLLESYALVQLATVEIPPAALLFLIQSHIPESSRDDDSSSRRRGSLIRPARRYSRAAWGRMPGNRVPAEGMRGVIRNACRQRRHMMHGPGPGGFGGFGGPGGPGGFGRPGGPGGFGRPGGFGGPRRSPWGPPPPPPPGRGCGCGGCLMPFALVIVVVAMAVAML